MKIGALCFKENVKPSQIAEEFYNNHIDTIELCYNKELNLKEIKNIRKFNLDISLHCPYENLRLHYPFFSFVLNKPKFYFKKDPIKEVEKSFLVAEKLEATHYVLHGGTFPKGYFRFKRLRQKEKFLKAFIKRFKPLFLKARDIEVKIVLENLLGDNLFAEAFDIEYVQEKFPWLGFCFDFAHSELTKQTDILKNLKIDHVHVSDNDLKNDIHLSLGEGKINFIKLLNILKTKNYDGKIIAECRDIQCVVKSVAFSRKIFKNNKFQKIIKYF